MKDCRKWVKIKSISSSHSATFFLLNMYLFRQKCLCKHSWKSGKWHHSGPGWIFRVVYLLVKHPCLFIKRIICTRKLPRTEKGAPEILSLCCAARVLLNDSLTRDDPLTEQSIPMFPLGLIVVGTLEVFETDGITKLNPCDFPDWALPNQ